MDTSHLDALELRLSHERQYLARDYKNEDTRALRTVWIAQIEKEISLERAKLGLSDAIDAMSDDELLEALK
jgi:hypothetical protein